MPKINPKLKTLDDLFALEAETVPAPNIPIVEKNDTPNNNVFHLLPVDSIRAFENHPFHLYDGEQLDDLVSSVMENGILIPTIVRKIEADPDGYDYEMLAGHNRQHAAQIAGLEAIPCIVKENITDEEAWMYVVETNVIQRSFTDMLPSEKAAVLALRYSKMFSQGKRNDIIEELERLSNPDYSRETTSSGTEFHRTKSRDKLGAGYDLTGRAVAKYVRVFKLIKELKERLDDGEITLTVSVELSYLSEAEQQMIDDVLADNEYKVDMKKAGLLRSYAGRLDDDLAEQILSGEKNRKPKSTTPPPVKIKHTVYSKYFSPGTKSSEIERIVDEALALYFNNAEENTSA